MELYCAMSAIDHALWDIAGKRAGVGGLVRFQASGLHHHRSHFVDVVGMIVSADIIHHGGLNMGPPEQLVKGEGTAPAIGGSWGRPVPQDRRQRAGTRRSEGPSKRL